jgi:hypothetical protein
MRGTLQARSARLALNTRGLRRPSWPAMPTLRRQITGEELETIERLSRESRRARRQGGYRPDASFQRAWR